jgi:hypothetical protein
MDMRIYCCQWGDYDYTISKAGYTDTTTTVSITKRRNGIWKYDGYQRITVHLCLTIAVTVERRRWKAQQ